MSGEPNGKKDLLVTLLSDPDRLIKLGTIALILISGGGNLFATKNAESVGKHEMDQAIREIHEMHHAFDTAMDRQKELIEYIRDQKRKNP